MANLENYTKKVLILYNDRQFVKIIFRKHFAKKIELFGHKDRFLRITRILFSLFVSTNFLYLHYNFRIRSFIGQHYHSFVIAVLVLKKILIFFSQKCLREIIFTNCLSLCTYLILLSNSYFNNYECFDWCFRPTQVIINPKSLFF